jgi:hypothetical protein
MNRIIIVLVFTFILFNSLLSQKTSLSDYQVGSIRYGSIIDSNIFRYHPLNHTEKLNHSSGEFITGYDGNCFEVPDSMVVYKFDSLIICVDQYNYIRSYEYTSSGYTTKRGIRIGDNYERVKAFYDCSCNIAGFGTELKDYEDRVIACCETEMKRGIVFYFTKGKLTRVFVGKEY